LGFCRMLVPTYWATQSHCDVVTVCIVNFNCYTFITTACDGPLTCPNLRCSSMCNKVPFC
jgi:hypothetical protein